MRKIYLGASKLIKILMRVIWNYEVINIAGLKKAQSCLIASNHLSWFDPPFIGAMTPFEIAYLAKSELFKYKFGSFILRLGNAIPVKRDQVDMNAISRVLKVLDSGKSLMIFPQGGINRKSIKPGVGLFAMKMKKDIIPVCVKNTDKPFSCLFRLKKTMIVVGEPIKYESFADWELTRENFQKLANLVYERIIEMYQNIKEAS